MLKRVGLLVLVLLLMPVNAEAHQPVFLSEKDNSANNGPLLVDGTISFAVYANFTKAGQSRGFRANLKAGEALSVQYLIFDRKPENRYKNSKLPKVVITSPTGKTTEIKFTERTKFFEPFSRTKFLYLSRINQVAEAGTYSFLITSRGKASITLGVGELETTGEVIPGPAVTPTPSPTPTKQVGFTMAEVAKNNGSPTCWSAINGSVYDLTNWINSHPGGAGAIRMICGTDGSSSFNGKHQGQANPESRLRSYLIGPLVN